MKNVEKKYLVFFSSETSLQTSISARIKRWTFLIRSLIFSSFNTCFEKHWKRGEKSFYLESETRTCC